MKALYIIGPIVLLLNSSLYAQSGLIQTVAGGGDDIFYLGGNGPVDFPDFLAFAQAFGKDVE